VSPQGGQPGYVPLPDEEPLPEEMPVGAMPIEVPEERPRTRGTFVGPQIINLMRVPGVQQVMLKVQVAELNRTALRNIGADMFLFGSKTTLGSLISGASVDLVAQPNEIFFPGATTAFGIFDNGEFQIFLTALCANGVSTILAEPNLVAMNGHEASFQAGGEVPVPVPQAFGVNTVEYRDFGVLLTFVPTILDDETIRLRVAPEVSDIVEFIQVEGFGRVPSFATRNVQTTVELKQGQTLALAGLLQVDLDATTTRIPGLGHLPYLGPLFSNTSHERVEKELLVMVTPYLVSPMEPCEVPPMPGSEILDPNCLEFYLMNRIEGRTGQYFRTTTSWDDPCYLRHRLELEQQHFCGPMGYSK
jgi:pilus assembly protein CpaC